MESFKDVFELVCEYCKGEISEVAYKLWISCLKPVRMEADCVYLSVKTDFQRDIVEEKYLSLLKSGFSRILGFDIEVKIVSESSEEKKINQAGSVGFQKDTEMNTRACSGEYEYTFDTFIIGNSNKFAHAASNAVAVNPAGTYNPLFIYGGSGLGKTHLLFAIYNEIRNAKPEMNIVYVKGDEFTNEFISSVKEGRAQDFHKKYRSSDVLLMDDIQFIGGKEQTQEEFFHTFNKLHQDGKQIVLTSDRPPKEIKTLEDRLRTRFEWGLIADIQPPDFETRIAIIKRKAELLKFDISNEIAEFIAEKLKNNIRQLEGAVKKMHAYSFYTKTPITISLAQGIIKDILEDNLPIPITVEKILSEICKIYSVDSEDIKSKKRSANIASARHTAIYVVREVTGMSLEAIGDEFGGRDHSTVVYSLKEVKENMENDTRYREMIEDIIKNIRHG